MMKILVKIAAAGALCVAGPAFAQIDTIDPNRAERTIDPAPETWNQDTVTPSQESPVDSDWTPTDSAADRSVAPEQSPYQESRAPTAERASTIPRDDVFSAAEDVFGRGAEGLAGLLESVLRDQGEPTAYISGQEAGAAFVFGVRYGSGTMRHQIEGERAVHWTGPSLGFDVGADANKVFVLVYNLHDSEQLFKRFAGAEGHAYFVGGFNAQYLRRGDVVLIPIRLGVGLRLGVNAGYMRFTERSRWVPF